MVRRIGIIVMAMAILPFLQVGGMRLFQAESSDIPVNLCLVEQYGICDWASLYSLTLLVMLCIGLAMHTFDAIVHGMTTIATAGFSNYDASFGHFADSPFLMITGTLFMVAGALPFVYIFVR